MRWRSCNPCQVGSLEEKIPNQSGQCVPSSCLIAIKECICFSSLTVLDICIYVICVSQFPSCFSRSAIKSKVSEQQNYYFNITWNAYNCLWDKMEENVCTITSVTLQITYAFASHPPKDAAGSSYLSSYRRKIYSEKEILERPELCISYTMK